MLKRKRLPTVVFGVSCPFTVSLGMAFKCLWMLLVLVGFDLEVPWKYITSGTLKG